MRVKRSGSLSCALGCFPKHPLSVRILLTPMEAVDADFAIGFGKDQQEWSRQDNARAVRERFSRVAHNDPEPPTRG